MLTHMPWAVEPNNAADRLRRIEAVTDTALVQLSVEQLLHELVDRVRDVLEADTATALLLDASGQQLVATASSGLEEEVWQNVRIRVGDGFAGRIAADLKPSRVSQVDHDTVVNPVLWEKGLRSLLGVPLIAQGEPLGVLHVGALDDRAFDDEDVRLLQLAADRVALAARSRLTNSDRAAASAVQRSLVPAQLPDVTGFELAARYAPGRGSDISGDWYDAFGLPSGRLFLVAGDVVGRGLSAAMVMSRIRTTVRAYALENDDPAEVLTRLDRNIRHFEPDAMATLACAIWDSSHNQVHLSLAGHLAPVVSRVNRDSTLVEAAVDPPVGVGSATQARHTTTIDMSGGAVLVLYTDGLVERRAQPLEDGLRALSDVVYPGPPEAVCTEIMNTLVGDTATEDDLALLAARRQNTDDLRTLTFSVDAVPEALADIRTELRRWLPEAGAGEDDVTDLLVAVGEAAANVIEHAYGPGGGTLSLHLETHGDDLDIIVSDTGSWRPPRGTHRGRGTELMRSLCDDVQVENGPQGTSVLLRKRLSGSERE